MATRFISAHQRRRIQQIIRDGHLAFLAEMFGPTAIDAADYTRLHAAGKIRDEKLMPTDAASAAHAIGSIAGDDQVGALSQMRAEAEQERVASPSLDSPADFWRRLRDDPQVVAEAEREAISILRDRIGQHVRGLGDRLDSITGHLLVDADDQLRRKRLTAISSAVAVGVEERATAADVANRIRHATRDLKRDWLRTAHTELHNAKEEAKAIVLAHRSPDHDPRVFKRPRPDACSFCVLLYLRPDKVTPRVFKLSELLANGTNVGRRAGRPSRSGSSRTEWKAVVGAMHPFCQCELHVLPPGMGFNKRGEMVYTGTEKSIESERLDEALAKHTCEER